MPLLLSPCRNRNGQNLGGRNARGGEIMVLPHNHREWTTIPDGIVGFGTCHHHTRALVSLAIWELFAIETLKLKTVNKDGDTVVWKRTQMTPRRAQPPERTHFFGDGQRLDVRI